MQRPEGEYIGIDSKPKKNSLIAKGNLLVHASYWMTINEKKLMWWIIWGYQQHQSQKLTVKLQPFFNWACPANNGRAYEETWEAARRLRAREIAIPKPDEERVGVCGFLRYAEYGEDRSGEIDVVITDEMLPYIESYIKDSSFGFTRYEMDVIGSLKTFRGHRCFELAKAMNFGSMKRQGFRLSFQDLRTRFGCYTVDRKGKVRRNEYTEWKRFKSKVLDPAIKEVGDVSDLCIRYVIEKTGRRVTGVRMFVVQGVTDEVETSVDARDQYLAVELAKLGIQKKRVKKFLDEYKGESRGVLELALKETNKQVRKGGVGNPAGLFVELVKVDLQKQADAKLVKKLDNEDAKFDAEKRAVRLKKEGSKRSGKQRKVGELISGRKYAVED